MILLQSELRKSFHFSTPLLLIGGLQKPEKGINDSFRLHIGHG